MEFDLSLIVNSLPLLLKGAGLTLEITALAVGLGLIIGLFLGLAQLSKNPIFRWPAPLRSRGRLLTIRDKSNSMTGDL